MPNNSEVVDHGFPHDSEVVDHGFPHDSVESEPTVTMFTSINEALRNALERILEDNDIDAALYPYSSDASVTARQLAIFLRSNTLADIQVGSLADSLFLCIMNAYNYSKT